MSVERVPRRDRKSPAELWQQAESEFPGKPVSRRARYRELMRQHGHLVARPPSPQTPPPGRSRR